MCFNSFIEVLFMYMYESVLIIAADATLTGCRRSGRDESGFTFPFRTIGLNSTIL